MRMLIFGANGMLGHKLIQEFSGKHDVFATCRRSKETQLLDLGIIEPHKVVSFDMHYQLFETIRSCNPDVVINCIGIVKQLKDAKSPLKSVRVNSLFPHELNETCGFLGIKLIHVSTDCVFNGKKTFYQRNNGDVYIDPMYNEESTPNPEDLYGRSKLLGEVSDPPGITLRTSIIGRELKSTTGLIEWFLSQNGKMVKGFSRAYYTGFTTIEFAKVIDAALKVPLEPGVYHASADEITKYELLKIVRDKFNLDIVIEKDEEFYCDRRLDSCRFRMLTSYQPPTWEQMIDEMANDPTPYDEWRAR